MYILGFRNLRMLPKFVIFIQKMEFTPEFRLF